MTLTKERIEEVMTSSIGSMTFFKRTGTTGMDYTEGVMNFQRELNAYWFVDLMYSHMPAVLKDYEETEESFYVVKLIVNADHTATFKVTREEYDTESEEVKDIEVATQDLEYTDFPACTVKFFLELANIEPVVFRLLCPSEH